MLHFGNYGITSNIAFPQKLAWERKEIDTDPLGNDEVGDCTIAAPGHAIQNMTMVANWSRPTQVTKDMCVKAYSDVTGYKPSDPSTDQGANMTDVCAYLKTTGLAGFTFDGWVALDHTNVDQIKAANFIFGWVYFGISVPDKLADALNGPVPPVWNYKLFGSNPSGEGHALGMFGHGKYGLAFNSWGLWLHMDWDFWLANVDEAYALVSKAWLKQSGISPSGFDYESLLNDLQHV